MSSEKEVPFTAESPSSVDIFRNPINDNVEVLISAENYKDVAQMTGIGIDAISAAYHVRPKKLFKRLKKECRKYRKQYKNVRKGNGNDDEND